MNRLQGRAAFVTGAAHGIGRAAALAFAAEGARVCAADRDAAGLAALAARVPGIATVVLDVADEAQVHGVGAPLADADVLLNCAGLVAEGALLDCTAAELRRMLEVNVVSMYHAVACALPGMLARGRGSIVNVASVVSSLKGAPGRFAYGVSKAAVIGLTKSVAADYVRQGVRCNAICPGTVDSPSLRARLAARPDPEQARREFLARQPMARFGTVEEIAALAVYLASDESAFTTGAVHVIDGGWTG